MNNKTYMIEKSDGSVSICRLYNGATIEEVIDKIHYKNEIVSVKEISEDDIPKDRHYRNAWIGRDGKLSPDLQKSKQIALQRIRNKRNKDLEETDKEWLTAFSKGDTVAVEEVNNKKKKLRDKPQEAAPRIEKVTSTDQLKDIEDEYLR